MVDVLGDHVIAGRGDPAGLTDGRLHRVEFPLDRRFDIVGELDATGGEQLDAVVTVRVVRGRHHRPHRTGALGGEGNGRRGDDAEATHVDALRGEPGRERGLEHRRGDPRVATDHDGRGVAGRQHARRGTAEAECELGGQLAVGHTADTVGPELHGRTGIRGRISAW